MYPKDDNRFLGCHRSGRSLNPGQQAHEQQILAEQLKNAETNEKAVQRQIDEKESFSDSDEMNVLELRETKFVDVTANQRSEAKDFKVSKLGLISRKNDLNKCYRRVNSEKLTKEVAQANSWHRKKQKPAKATKQQLELENKEQKQKRAEATKQQHELDNKEQKQKPAEDKKQELELENKNKLLRRTNIEAVENEAPDVEVSNDVEDAYDVDDPGVCRVCGKSYIPEYFGRSVLQTRLLTTLLVIETSFCSCSKVNPRSSVHTNPENCKVPAIHKAADGCHGDDPDPGSGDAGGHGDGEHGDEGASGAGHSTPPGGGGGGSGDGGEDREPTKAFSKVEENDEEEKEKDDKEEEEEEDMFDAEEQADTETRHQDDEEPRSGIEKLSLYSTQSGDYSKVATVTRSVSNVSGDSGFEGTATDLASPCSGLNRSDSMKSPDSGLGDFSPDHEKDTPLRKVNPGTQKPVVDFVSQPRPYDYNKLDPIIEISKEAQPPKTAEPRMASLNIVNKSNAEMLSCEHQGTLISREMSDISLRSSTHAEEVGEEGTMEGLEESPGANTGHKPGLVDLKGPKKTEILPSMSSSSFPRTVFTTENSGPSEVLVQSAHPGSGYEVGQDTKDEEAEESPYSEENSGPGDEFLQGPSGPAVEEPRLGALRADLEIPGPSIEYRLPDYGGISYLGSLRFSNETQDGPPKGGAAGVVPKHSAQGCSESLQLPQPMSCDGVVDVSSSANILQQGVGQPQQPQQDVDAAMMLPTGAESPRAWNLTTADDSISSTVAYNTVLEMIQFVIRVMRLVRFDRRYQHAYGRILDKMAPHLRIIDDHYDWNDQWMEVQRLGSGGQGSCHLAQDLNTDFKFVYKKIFWKNFRPSELEILLRMPGHPHCIEPFGLLYFDDHFYLLMEYVEGPSLRELIDSRFRSGAPLSLYEALHILRQILDVLLHLKNSGVLHDDLKAENLVLMSQSDQAPFWIKLIDFGMSKLSAVPPGDHCEGTRTHWSREKARNDGHSFPADLYAAVMVFVVMLLSYVPRDELGLFAVQYKMGEEGAPNDHLELDLPDNVRDLIQQGFHDDPVIRATVESLLRHAAFSLLECDPQDPMFYQHIVPRQTLDVCTTENLDPIPDLTSTPSFSNEINDEDESENRAVGEPFVQGDVEMEDDQPLLGAVGGDPEDIRRAPTEDSDDIRMRYSDIQFCVNTSRFTDRQAVHIQENQFWGFQGGFWSENPGGFPDGNNLNAVPPVPNEWNFEFHGNGSGDHGSSSSSDEANRGFANLHPKKQK